MNKRIKELRTALDLTAEKFGKKIGVTRSAISNLESGHRNVTGQTIMLIVNKFNVNEQWLRTGEGAMFIDSDDFSLDDFCKSRNMSELELGILKAFFNIPENIRKQALQYFVDGVHAQDLDLALTQNKKNHLRDLYELSGAINDENIKTATKGIKKHAK